MAVSFLIDPFRFVVEFVAGVIWDVLDKTASVVLSSGGSVATAPPGSVSGTDDAVRASLAHATGLYYFEVEMLAPAFIGGSSEGPWVGIARSSVAINSLASAPKQTGSFVVAPSLSAGMQFFQNGTAVSNPTRADGSIIIQQPVPSGTVFGFAVNLTAKRMWVRCDTVEFSSKGNPEFNQLPHFASIPNVPMDIFGKMQDVGESWPLKLNAGQAPFKFRAPNGFQSWDAVQPAPPVPAPPARAGTLPSSLAGAVAYIDCGDKTCLFTDAARAAQAGDMQCPITLRFKNNTGRGFSNGYNQASGVYFDEDAFGPGAGALVVATGRRNVASWWGYAMTLSTSASLPLSIFTGTAAFTWTFGLRFTHECQTPYPGDDSGSNYGQPVLEDNGGALGIYVSRPPGAAGGSHVRVTFALQNASSGVTRSMYADFQIGAPGVVTMMLRGGAQIIRLNGVQLTTRAGAAISTRGGLVNLLRDFMVGRSNETVMEIKEIAMNNTGMTDANALLQERYIASGMGLTL